MFTSLRTANGVPWVAGYLQHIPKRTRRDVLVSPAFLENGGVPPKTTGLFSLSFENEGIVSFWDVLM